MIDNVDMNYKQIKLNQNNSHQHSAPWYTENNRYIEKES